MKNTEVLMLNLLFYQQKRTVHLRIAILLVAIICVGGTLNSMAVKNNECKMPVLGVSPYITDTHVGVRDEYGINYPLLVDRFKFGVQVYSIGDFLVLISFSLLFTNSAYLAAYNIEIWKLRERLRKVYK